MECFFKVVSAVAGGCVRQCPMLYVSLHSSVEGNTFWPCNTGTTQCSPIRRRNYPTAMLPVQFKTSRMQGRELSGIQCETNSRIRRRKTYRNRTSVRVVGTKTRTLKVDREIHSPRPVGQDRGL